MLTPCGTPLSGASIPCMCRFDYGRFYAEAERVLQPGGILAFWHYEVRPVVLLLTPRCAGARRFPPYTEQMPTFTGCPEATQLQHHLVNSLFKEYWAPDFWVGKGFYQGVDAVSAYLHKAEAKILDQA